MSTFAGSLTGQSGYREDTGTRALFMAPIGVAYQCDSTTKTERLLVADRDSEHFRSIDLKTGVRCTLCFGRLNLDACSGVTRPLAGPGVTKYSDSKTECELKNPFMIRPDPCDTDSLLCSDQNSVRRIKAGQQHDDSIQPSTPLSDVRRFGRCGDYTLQRIQPPDAESHVFRFSGAARWLRRCGR